MEDQRIEKRPRKRNYYRFMASLQTRRTGTRSAAGLSQRDDIANPEVLSGWRYRVAAEQDRALFKHRRSGQVFSKTPKADTT